MSPFGESINIRISSGSYYVNQKIVSYNTNVFHKSWTEDVGNKYAIYKLNSGKTV